MSKKLRTTIHVDEELIDAVRMSGVRNISAYLSSLIKADLVKNDVDKQKDEDFAQEYSVVLNSLEEEWKQKKI